MSTFVLQRKYALQLPNSFVDVDSEEMEYVDGGWNLSISGTKTALGVPVGIYLTLSGTVADMAWITAAGAAFVGVIIGLALTVPGIGPALALKAGLVASGFVAFAATVVATNDRANTSRFSTTLYLGI